MSNIPNQVIYSVRILEGWMTAVVIAISVFISKLTTRDVFYNFGPSSTFVVLGMTIDTYTSYTCLLIYCFINTIIRNLNIQYVTPFITNVVHDTTVNKNHLSKRLIYEIVLLNIIYVWVDWFIYINLLLSQLDMVIVEIIADIIVTSFITRNYLKTSENTKEILEEITEEISIDPK